MNSYLTLLLLSALVSDVFAYPSNRLLKSDSEEFRELNEEGKEMICRLNALRRKNGKKDVLLDRRTMLTVQKHAEAMKQHNKFTHEGFTSKTKGFMDRIHLEGYADGQNICQGSVMMTDYQCFGYGRDHKLWVQDFASDDKCIGYDDINCSKYTIDEGLKQSLEGEESQLEDTKAIPNHQKENLLSQLILNTVDIKLLKD